MTSGDGEFGSAQSSGLGPLGDVQLLAAMLHNDRNDVASFARVLTGALGEALPRGVVEVQYERSMGDRMAGRPGRPVRLTVRGTDRELDLAEGRHGAVQAQVRKVVGGVVISRKEIGIDEWVRQFAAELSAQAAQNAAARQALAALLGM
ncbi:hypothetical protein SAMN04515671_2005 [Nakamurella panacisegetis]|uniref:Uncharacterized protein n=1 Tax=Nakamurella panacisegetis TaxID=1090615 RepID=A0A1H0MG21_9ACTN|nr:hypothetical protein [Nakamurella panacisegetis]SDO79383.1 hypothetical protein SAMN04515671_2005 [Nakamurella panacisegetis]